MTNTTIQAIKEFREKFGWMLSEKGLSELELFLTNKLQEVERESFEKGKKHMLNLIGSIEES